ncbi:MAG: alginate lyase family protein [Chloroflexi bacterium]|nr:alginate lyase family protein [Chloroflexota bacterium]
MSGAETLSHPRLLATPALIEQARARITAGFSPAMEGARQVRALAEKAADIELPVFDHSWYAGKTFEDWPALYPLVAQHCTYIPEPPATAALGAALDFALTGRSESLAAVRRVLTHYADTFQFDVQHYDVGMNYSVWGLPLLYAYDLVYDALDEHAAIDAFFGEYVRAVQTNDREWIANGWGGLYNNHYAWHHQGIATYGLMFNRPELLDYAFNNPMGIRACLINSLTDEGLWFESATGYNFVGSAAYAVLAWCLRNSGAEIDLFSVQYGPYKSLRAIYDAALALLLPDGILPNVGDCYGRRAALPTVQYELAYAVYGDPRYAWVLARQREGAQVPAWIQIFAEQELGLQLKPRVVTRLWPEHGYTLLTQAPGGDYFGDQSSACFVNWAYSGIHHHQDRLSIELYAQGKRWLVDAESLSSGHGFSAPVQRQLNRSTLCHNLVMVDGRDQRSVRRNLRLVEFSAENRRISVCDGGMLVEGVIQHRTLQLDARALHDEYLLDSAAPHQYDYQLHFEPGCEVSSDLALNPIDTIGEGEAYTWARGLQQADVQGDQVSLIVTQAGREMHVRIDVPAGSKVLCGYLPRTHDYVAPHRPFVIVRSQGKSCVRFNTEFTW